MSNYPNWWNSTITIYNKYENPTTSEITWYRKSIDNCFISDNFLRTVFEKQVDTANSLIVRIPQSSSYKSASAWDVEVNKSNYFTLRQGDIIINGTVTDTVDEYGATGTITSNDLIVKYKKSSNCMVINVFQDNTGTGRGIPHYRVNGN